MAAINLHYSVKNLGVVVTADSYQCTKQKISYKILTSTGISWLFLQTKQGPFFSNMVTSNSYLVHHLATRHIDVTIGSIVNCKIVLYRMSYPYSETMKKVGQWSVNKFVLIEDTARNMPDLQGLMINITSEHQQFSHQNRQLFDQSVLGLLRGVLNMRLHMISNPQIFKSKDLSILQQLSHDRADLSASTVLVTKDRTGLVQYSIAVDIFRPSLYYKVQSVRAARNIYILPFSSDVWVSLVSLLLAITVALTFILGSETRLPSGIKEQLNKQNNVKALTNSSRALDSDLQPHWDLSEVMLVTFGAVSQQGSYRDPTTSAARTLFITLFVLAVLTYTAYSASVISLMSSAQPVINTLNGILQDGSKMGLALHDNHYYRTQFESEPNPVSCKLHELEEAPLLFNLQHGFDSVSQGDLAFSADRVEAYTHLHSSQRSVDVLCSIGEIRLLRLMEHGLIARERHRWFPLNPLCQSTDSTAGSLFISIAVEDISPALCMLGYAVVIALILLPIELGMHYCLIQIKKHYGQLFSGVNIVSWRARVQRNDFKKRTTQKWLHRVWRKLKSLIHIGSTNLPFLH
ncbi:uncharacterized protein [Anabrus simplex]|uniref:uncharacterized protein isoform X2 n=1 Tax=Anabrus simplex TaxID=316456 RepID=UPI0035A3178C